jgi:molecular chaperone DnaK (HSP70)
MPAVARRLAAELGVPVELRDPDLAVAKGAALYGEKKALERLVIADLVTRGQLPDGAGVESAASADLDAACRRLAEAIGSSAERVRRTVEVSVVNVVSRGFGVLALDRFGDQGAVFLVHRNDRLPIAVRRPFGTVRDDQDTVTVYVVEQAGGVESRNIEDNKIIAEADITGIPPGYPAGTQIEITFPDGVRRHPRSHRHPRRARRPGLDRAGGDVGRAQPGRRGPRTRTGRQSAAPGRPRGTGKPAALPETG